MHKVGIKDNDLYVIKEIYKPKMTATDILKEIKRTFPDNYNNIVIYADNARPEVIEELRRNGISGIRPCTKGAGSVLDGIEWLQDRNIYIDSSCTGALNEIEAYQWKYDKRTGQRIPKPVEINDDAMDSIRYATEPFRGLRKEFRVAVF